MSDYIAQDLLVLILKRLPVKTLLRCRSVCKPWKQLIASNSFIVDHLALQKRRIIAQNGHLSYLLFDPQTLPLFEKLTPPFKFKREHRSYYGFTLSSHHGVNCLYNHTHLLLLLHNPSIRQHLIIPLPKLPIFSRDDTFFCSGFWIHPPSNDFKVLVFRLEYGDAAIFSSKERSWTEFKTSEIGYHSPYSSPQVMVGDVSHWTTCLNEDDTLLGGGIVTFDFQLHKFGTIKLPPKSQSIAFVATYKELLKSASVTLCRWQDSLSIVSHGNSWFSNECESWVMRNGSWIRMFRIKLPQNIYHVHCVLGSRGRVLASNDTDRLVVHDPKDGVIRLKTRLVDIDRGLFSLSYDFVESLVFPDRNCIPVIECQASSLL